MKVQKDLDSCTESIWSGTLKFHTRPRSQSNDQRQAMVISGCRLHSCVQINSVNWPKQLKMTTISCDGYKKLRDLHVMRNTWFVTFSMDEDCDKMSHRAVFQSTSLPNYCGCALVEYTSSGISLLILRSCSLGDENVTLGFIHKCTYQDSAVELLTDLGILSHATTANMLAKDIASLKEELQQKDKELVEQQILHQEEMENQILIAEEKSTGMEVEREALMKDKKEQYEELKKKDTALEELKERLKNEKEKMLVEQQQLMKNMQQKGMEEKTKIMAEAWRNLTKMREDMEAVKNQEKEKLVNRLNEAETRHLELVEVKQAALDDIKQTIEKDLKCSICQQLFIKTTTLNCSHSFCAYCINKWREENDTCPICREDIQTPVQCLAIDNYIEKVINKLGDEAKQRRKETMRERKEVMEQEGLDDDDDDESDDQSSTLIYQPSPASMWSPYWRSPASIENMFSPQSASSTNSASPA